MSLPAKLVPLSTGYQPRPLQAKLHMDMKRFNVLVCHRRFGKTVFATNDMLDRAIACTRESPQLAYIAPNYGQAERVAWDMLKKYSHMMPGVEYNQQKLTCVIPRPWLKDRLKLFLLGAENPDSIRGMYLDWATLDEFATMTPSVWGKVVRPALSDRMGGATFIGTPNGNNHFKTVYDVAGKDITGTWFRQIYKASTTGIIPPEELAQLRAEMTEDEFNQEFECDFSAAITGAYYAKIINEIDQKGQIGKVPHDPALLVDTFWDLGVNDTTTIWFVQQFRQEVRIIDYVEASGNGLPHYVKVLKEGHRASYSYREHHWPHDGGSRDLSTGQERSQTMRDLGVRVIVNKKHDVADGIDSVRRLLPKCYFDVAKCADGLDSLKNYQKKYDEKNDIYSDTPKHDWASHGSDAFRLMGMVLKPGDDRLGDRKNLPRQAETDYDLYKF